ncbi:MAG: Type secretion system protein [Pseudomonadota bacterium]
MERRIEEFSHKSIEVLSILGSLLGIVIMVNLGISVPSSIDPEEVAIQRAKILAYSLWQIELKNITSPEEISQDQGRTIASPGPLEGSIGKDPWGRPFRYAFSKGNQLLFVWSVGPDGKSESSGPLQSLLGDDLGYLLDLKVKQ